jgi:hypothetical protein
MCRKRSCLMERTSLSAYAFKFGLYAGTDVCFRSSGVRRRRLGAPTLGCALSASGSHGQSSSCGASRASRFGRFDEHTTPRPRLREFGRRPRGCPSAHRKGERDRRRSTSARRPRGNRRDRRLSPAEDERRSGRVWSDPARHERLRLVARAARARGAVEKTNEAPAARFLHPVLNA